MRTLNGLSSIGLFLAVAFGQPAKADEDEWIPPIKVEIPLAYQDNWVRSDIPDCVKDDPYAILIGPRSIYRYEKYEFLEIAQLNYADVIPEFSGLFIVAENQEFGRITENLRMENGLLIITTSKVDMKTPTLVQKFKRCKPI